MIQSTDIMQAIRLAVTKHVPEIVQIHDDLIPKEYKCPSLLIQSIHTDIQDSNKALVDVTEYFTLILYDKTDDYHHSNTRNLLTLRDKVMRIFRLGYFKVEDPDHPEKARALHVIASAGGRDFDKAFIDVQFQFHDVRTEEKEILPMMEEVDMITTVKPKTGR